MIETYVCPECGGRWKHPVGTAPTAFCGGCGMRKVAEEQRDAAERTRDRLARERDNFKARYHEAMLILGDWDNIEKAQAIAQYRQIRDLLTRVWPWLDESNAPAILRADVRAVVEPER